MRRLAIAVALLLLACRTRSSEGGEGGRAVSTAPATSPSTTTGTPTATPNSTATGSSTPNATPPLPLHPQTIDKPLCLPLAPGGEFAPFFLSRADLTTSYVNGDDWLALVNRSPLGTLPPSYAPSDLVDFFTGKPATAAQCETQIGSCLRREAAEALRAMLAEMKKAGHRGRIESAFRSYGAQCGVFAHWAHKEGSSFCRATEQSALPGHSQHQLGTTVDLFTEEWFREGKEKGEPIFRSGFGCTRAGAWLAEHAWRFGFVLPYPIHPDDRHPSQACVTRWDIPVPVDPRTGYRHEPWHLRYIGVEAAARFRDDWLASHPGTPTEITLEQWLRRRAGLVGDADLPVCDGCACGACATLARPDGGPSPCGDDALWLEPSGRPFVPAEAPRLEDVRAEVVGPGTVRFEVKVYAPPHTLTQPPVLAGDGPRYQAGATFESLVPYPRTQPRGFRDLPGAWRIAIEPVGSARPSIRWPWRASLARPALARTYNRANVLLPAAPGASSVQVTVEVNEDTRAFRVALLLDGDEHDPREIVAR